MRMGFNFRAGDRIHGTLTQGERTEALRADLWGTAHLVSPAIAGRVNKFDFPVPGSKLQADGSYTLDLNAQIAGQEILTQDSNIVSSVSVAPRVQALGWQSGDYYMLEKDGDGNIIVEPGRNHRKIHVTAGAHGYTAAQIEAELGLSAGTVNNAWLAVNPIWGATPDKALSVVLGQSFWLSLLGTGRSASSIWLMLERGFSYNNATFRLPFVARGESPLHPNMICAYGTGNPPANLDLAIVGWTPAHFVARDLDQARCTTAAGHNILFHNIRNSNVEIGASAPNGMTGLTYHRCLIADAHAATPKVGDTSWGARSPHIGGSFWTNVLGMLLWENIYDYNGWREGFNSDGLWNNGEFPQPPIALSQNMYVQWTCQNVGVFDNLSARAAAAGIQLRGGGYSIGNIFLDNNLQANDLGGDYKQRGPVGEWSIWDGNVATSAGHRKGPGTMAISYGLDLFSRMIASIDNILCHKANPDDAAEIASKTRNEVDIKFPTDHTAIFDNSPIWRWKNGSENNRYVEGLDPEALDETTIQRYAATRMGGTPTIKDYLNFVRTLPASERAAEIHAVRRYFQAAYQPNLLLPRGVRTAPVASTFIPDYRTEGFRWDVPVNWSAGVVPGLVAGDTVNLFGNRVKFVRHTATVASITFGAGGLLEVTSGKLTASAHADAANVLVSGCGQYFAPSGSGDYVVRGGRLAFTGAASVGLAASGDAETLLGGDLTIPEGKALRLDGGQGWTGWDGTGTATLTINGTLDMRSTPIFGTSSYNRRFGVDVALDGQESGFTGIADYHTHPTASTTVGQHIAVRELTALPTIGEQIMSSVPSSSITGDDSENDMPVVVTTTIPRVNEVYAATMPVISPFRSGMYGEAQPSVVSTVRLNGDVHLNVLGLAIGTYPLIKNAILLGKISNIRVTGLNADRDAQITLSERALTLEIINGTGQTFFREV